MHETVTPLTSLGGTACPHFITEATEAQRGEVSCPQSHGGSRAELGLELTHGKKSRRHHSWENMEKGAQAQASPESPSSLRCSSHTPLSSHFKPGALA